MNSREELARDNHNKSDVRMKPFISIDGSMTTLALESELFGHEAGSCPNAFCRKIGLLEVANGGTLFIDNFEKIDPAIRLKLLLGCKGLGFKRLGGDRTIIVRVVLAT